jgi:hypothetical protein
MKEIEEEKNRANTAVSGVATEQDKDKGSANTSHVYKDEFFC